MERIIELWFDPNRIFIKTDASKVYSRPLEDFFDVSTTQCIRSRENDRDKQEPAAESFFDAILSRPFRSACSRTGG